MKKRRSKKDGPGDLSIEDFVDGAGRGDKPRSRSKIVKEAELYASIYVTKTPDGRCHVTCFDSMVRQQHTQKLRDFDSLFILLQTAAYYHFEEFFEHFHTHPTTAEGALVVMQSRMKNVAKSEKERVRELERENGELKERLEGVRRLTQGIDLREEDHKNKLRTLKVRLSNILTHGEN